MRTATPSATAQHMTLVRALLHRWGVIEDPFASALLRQPWALAEHLLRGGIFRRLARTPDVTYVLTRTRFFDEAVRSSFADGITQVVIVAAGYDSRAWRLARPGVTFYEIDHPATQADKRARAPQGGPVFAAADLAGGDRLGVVLGSVGFDPGLPAIFTVEGLTMYLDDEGVAALLAEMAGAAAPGSRLVADFGVGGRRRFGAGGADEVGAAPLSSAVLVALTGERFTFAVAPGDATALLAATGWAIDELLTVPQQADRFLAAAERPTARLNSSSFALSGRRTPRHVAADVEPQALGPSWCHEAAPA